MIRKRAKLALVFSAFMLWSYPGWANAAVPQVCTGCSFAGASLPGADFGGDDYVGTDFSDSDLTRASFRGARLVAANFQGAKLGGAAFDGTLCVACNFDGATLDGATFAQSHLIAANFAGFHAVLSAGQLGELLSHCISCNFRRSRLAGADLSGTILISVDFSDADLRNVRFDDAVLCWPVVVKTQALTTCDQMAGAQVAGATFRNVLLCNDPATRASCTPVDADTLRRYSGSSLAGALVP
jgi:uncharacterized protein YjbI with pentapeptide repeats